MREHLRIFLNGSMRSFLPQRSIGLSSLVSNYVGTIAMSLGALKYFHVSMNTERFV